ncbi:hypothetical protein [Sphaerisporangium sp. NPDC051011]|uniref:hypothetical protein n=1 Tax=Sphaerisporangium sp. NPDC051011 TaxID=3155792 RepID=UPI003400ADB2
MIRQQHRPPVITAMLRLPDTPAVRAVEQLRLALAHHGIGARVYGGYGLALLVVGPAIVWCDGQRFWWCAGWDAQRRRPIYGTQQVGQTERTARRVVFHCTRLHERQPTQPPRRAL